MQLIIKETYVKAKYVWNNKNLFSYAWETNNVQPSNRKKNVAIVSIFNAQQENAFLKTRSNYVILNLNASMTQSALERTDVERIIWVHLGSNVVVANNVL